jgi:5-methylcytosine-specific restriction protein A
VSDDYYYLDLKHTDPKRLKKEREKARKLKKSRWWHEQIQKGICYYCKNSFAPSELTLDHVVPLARGGETKKGNCVPSCKKCNSDKKLATPVDRILQMLEKEKKSG